MHAHAQQGHLYQYGDSKVIAIESGPVVRVREVDPAEPFGLGRRYSVKASWLDPLPMKYFRGQIPSAPSSCRQENGPTA